VLQNIFSLFYQLIECWSSFAISWCRWNWSHDKKYILGLSDILCHITKNPNPNRKPVSGFQNLLKKYCSLHQKFFHKKSRLYQPSLNNNAENPNDHHSHSRNSLNFEPTTNNVYWRNFWSFLYFFVHLLRALPKVLFGKLLWFLII